MVNFDTISIIVFYGLLVLFFLKYKKRFTIQGKIFALYKTKLGLKLMDRIGKFSPRFMTWLGYVGVVVGFSGMGLIFFFLIKETLKFVTVPGTLPPLAPVLPGVTIPGAPTLSFWHWIIAIFIVAVVHEFSHGIFARVHKIKIKSSGFAFLGPILAAFVEPEEKQLAKTSTMKQLSVFAAGPFSNIVFGFIFLLILNLFTGPLVGSMFQPGGIVVNAYIEGYPAEESGLELPFTIKKINGEDTLDILQFINASKEIEPGDEINLETDKGEVDLIAAENPENESKGFMGVTNFLQKREIKPDWEKYGKLPQFVMWINMLIGWLFLINIGIGLFNLLPLGPVDGGRMFMTAALKIFKNKRTAIRIFGIVSWFVLLLIFINLWPWVVKLFAWIGSGFSFLITLV